MGILKDVLQKDKKCLTIAFLGDSVTQGCFECYKTTDGRINTVYDYKSNYSTRLREILNIVCPDLQVNIIDSGLSGERADDGFKRIERDVLIYNPDLVVVSYGLNDSTSWGIENINEYINSLESIFNAVNEKRIPAVFLTENFMCSNVSEHITDNDIKVLAEKFSKVQKEGVLERYFEAAKDVCINSGVTVCDCYNFWKKMKENGIDTTELLANKLNHPIREYHYYIAIKLFETILAL